jgi:hypothetical protein
MRQSHGQRVAEMTTIMTMTMLRIEEEMRALTSNGRGAVTFVAGEVT